MGKSKSRSGSEVRHLQGRIRQLESELKYYKKREHIFERPIEETEEVENVHSYQCEKCHTGLVIKYDFFKATLHRCDNCDFEVREAKK